MFWIYLKKNERFNNPLAEGPGVARGKNKIKSFLKKIDFFNTPRPPMSVHKKVRPIGPAVWPAIRNIYIYIYTNVMFYDIDIFENRG